MPWETEGQASTAAPLSPGRAWLTLTILVILAFVSMLDRQIISLMVDPIKADLGLSDTQIGLLQGLAFTLFYCAAALPLGWAVDRYRRTVICYLGVTVWSLGTMTCGFAGSFLHLFVARISVGAGEASLNPASVSLISDTFPREKVGRAMGFYGSSIALGSGFALVVGGLVVSFFGKDGFVALPVVGAVSAWQAVFMAVGLPGLFIAPLAFLLTDRRPVQAAASLSHRQETFIAYLRDHGVLVTLVLAGFSLVAFNFYAVGSWTPAFLARTYGIAISTIGWTWGMIVALSGAGGAILGGVLIDAAFRKGMDDAAIAVPGYAAALSWPVLAAAYQAPSAIAVLVLLGIAATLTGIISAGSFSVWQSIAPPYVRGRLSAIFGLVSTGLGATLGPVVPAVLTDRFFGDEMRVGAALTIVLSVVTPVMALAFFAARRVLEIVPTFPLGEPPVDRSSLR